MGLLTMSDKELKTLDVVKRLDEKTLTRRQASQLLNRSVRQTQRILNRYRKEGVAGLVSKHRGRVSNRAFAPSVREYALHLVRTLYGDFGPTFACEKLLEQHELTVSVHNEHGISERCLRACFTCSSPLIVPKPSALLSTSSSQYCSAELTSRALTTTWFTNCQSGDSSEPNQRAENI